MTSHLDSNMLGILAEDAAKWFGRLTHLVARSSQYEENDLP